MLFEMYDELLDKLQLNVAKNYKNYNRVHECDGRFDPRLSVYMSIWHIKRVGTVELYIKTYLGIPSDTSNRWWG